MEYFINALKFLLQGTLTTLLVFAITMLFSLPLGFLGAMLKKIKFKPLRLILDIYTWVIRGTPLLLQLYFFVYAIPIMTGWKIDRMSAASLAFIINYTAYFIEIFRGGMESINKGQYEAANVLGLSRWTMYTRIILPVTFKRVIPTLSNESMTLVKDTALLASVSVFELMHNTKTLVSSGFRLEPYLIAAAIYLVLSYGLVAIFKGLEKRYAHFN